MDLLSHEEAKRIMRDAHMICSLQHGYMVHISKENPYKKTTVDIPNKSICWLEEYDSGKVLKIEEEEKITLIAFLLTK